MTATGEVGDVVDMSITDRRAGGELLLNDRNRVFADTERAFDYPQLILHGARAGRPTWSLGHIEGARMKVDRRWQDWAPFEILVPRLEHTHESLNYAAARTELGDEMVDALMFGNARTLGRILNGAPKKTPHVQVRWLTAAALYDVYDWPTDSDERSICGYLDGSLDDSCPTTERGARKAICKGRGLWGKLAAWPWWGLDPHGQLGGSLGWKQDPDVQSRFEMWRDPRRLFGEPLARLISGP